MHCKSILNSSMKIAFFLVIFALMAACSTAPKITSDHDSAQDFSQYQQYAWIANETTGERYVDPLTIKRIRDSIQGQLAEQSYQPAENEAAADFLVTFTVGAQDRVDIYTQPNFTGFSGVTRFGRGRWAYRYYEPEIIADNYTEGSLAIDIFDAQSKQPVWHGYASKRLTSKDYSGDNEESIRQAVSAILGGFPPQ